MKGDQVGDRRYPDPRGNYLLRALSGAEFAGIAAALEPVHLPRSAELEAPNEPVDFANPRSS